jgi:hypothetical protein
MIVRFTRVLLPILFFGGSTFAGEIREFDLKTTERLGNELTRQSRRPDGGATSPVRKRAKQTAMQAVLPRLNEAYGPKYNFEVLNDPDGNGFLVYALATFRDRSAIYLGGHFRITVSADGTKAERIDDLSLGIMRNPAPADATPVGVGTAQAVDSKYPVETVIYESNLYQIPIGVGTRDGTIWLVANGKIEKMDRKLKEAQAKVQKKK